MSSLVESFVTEKAELVLQRLMHLENVDFKAEANEKRGKVSRDFGIESWDWPQGVGLMGLEKLQKLYHDTRYDAFLAEWYAKNVERGLPVRNINTTAPFTTLISFAERTDNPLYQQICRDHAHWVMHECPKTQDGGLQHITTSAQDPTQININEGQLWVDTLFMAGLFLAKAGVTYQNEEWIQGAIKQILVHIKYLYDKQTRLLHHGWSFVRNDNFGGVFWCRGNSWFTYGILELIEMLEGHLDEGSKQFMLDTYLAQVAVLRDLQAESGLWHTVLTDPTTYQEVSGSALFAAGICKGIRLGILDESYLPCAERAIDGIVRNIAPDGTVQNVSVGTVIGLDAAHYNNIVLAPISYGQSMTALALLEAKEYIISLRTKAE